MSTRTYLFAGGGTGGHIYPALAIAERLTRLDPEAQFKFIVSQRPLDGQILQDESMDGRHIDCIRIDAKPFGISPGAFLDFYRAWRPAIAKSSEFLDLCKKQGDVRVVALGGFVAAPVVKAAQHLALPVYLVNLDAIPGKSNRWVAARAKRTFTTYDVPMRTKWEKVGPIVRKRAVAAGSREACRQRLGLAPKGRTIFVTGASQGARTINEAVLLYVQKNADALRDGGWQFVHQTGEDDEAMVRFGYSQADIPAIVAAYTKDIGFFWGAADLAIARAGAGTVSEALANKVPTLFVPYPHHKDQHQTRNAQHLVDAGAARVIEDRNDPAHNALALASELATLLEAATLAKMREAFEKLGPCDGAASIAAALNAEK
jgi:UDP-N-acetylglucosamine--N-acetylmuramyl-(pentapeptide) pyrophosphoryl-undecaprenol N-acetylglucosamine transferase